MRRVVLRRALAPSFAVLLSILSCQSMARADPYRLRIDMVGYSQTPQSPVGLIVLQGDDRANSWVDAEALAWTGNVNGNTDVLSALVRLHDPRNYGELRLGRQIITVGAMRPIHVDGADARLRAPTGTSLEAFGGVPVQPQFNYRAWDWATGGRLGQSLGRFTNFGLSYLQQRADGAVSYEEAGFDFASQPVPWFDLDGPRGLRPDRPRARRSRRLALGPLRRSASRDLRDPAVAVAPDPRHLAVLRPR